MSLILDGAGRSPRHPHGVSQFDDILVREAVLRELSRRWSGFLRLQPRRRLVRARRSPEGARARGAHHRGPRTNVGRRARADDARFRRGQVRHLGGDDDHRKRPRHSACQHHHRRSRGLVRLAQLYQLRGRVGRAKERRLLLPARAAAEPNDRRGARAYRGARAPHGAGLGLRIAALDMELRGAGDLLGGRTERLRGQRWFRAVLSYARGSNARAAEAST